MDLDTAFNALLGQFNRYVSLTTSEWDDIRSYWKPLSFRKNEIIIAEGEVERNFYFITEGVHRLYFIDRKATEQTVAFGYHPNYSGNIYSLCTRKPSEYFVEALTHGSMLALAATDLDTLYDRYPVLDRWGRLLFSRFFSWSWEAGTRNDDK